VLPGPIFNVELLTSARRPRYLVVRTIYAAALLAALWINYESYNPGRYGYEMSVQDMARRAAAFFAIFSFIQLIAILLAGPAMIAGTIATERERRTIEYLFASQLSNAEIVLGKLAARLLHLLYLVAAGLPVLAMAMLMGGIEPAVLARVFVYCLMITVTIGAMSIAVSVSSPRGKDAMMRIYIILVALLLLPLLAWPFFGPQTVWVTEIIESTHPFIVLYNIQRGAMVGRNALGVSTGGWSYLMPSLVAQSIFSLIAIAWATRSVRRVHLKESGKSAKRRNFRLQLWRPKLGSSPMLWKELFIERVSVRLGVVAAVAQVLIVIAVIVGTLLLVGGIWWMSYVDQGYWRHRRDWRIREFLQGSMFMTIPLRGIALLLVAVRAASSMTSEKERDSWLSLLATPLTASEIVWGKLWGSLYATRNVVFLLLFVWVWGIFFAVYWPLVVLAAMAEFMLACAFVALVGVMYSLKCQTSLRATGATIATCVFVGGGYLFCCIPFMFGGGSDAMALILAPCLPFLAVFPEMVSVEGGRHMPGEIIAAFVLGNIGYVIVNFALLSSCIAGFDRLSGRMHGNRPLRHREARSAALPSVIDPPEGS
jgi:ABC-type transport system involved in multi-copper enzyme maturation permease subunit